MINHPPILTGRCLATDRLAPDETHYRARPVSENLRATEGWLRGSKTARAFLAFVSLLTVYTYCPVYAGSKSSFTPEDFVLSNFKVCKRKRRIIRP